jgi:hypothetical protein
MYIFLQTLSKLAEFDFGLEQPTFWNRRSKHYIQTTRFKYMRQKETRMETRSKAKENKCRLGPSAKQIPVPQHIVRSSVRYFQAKAFKKHNDIGKSGFRLSMSYSVSTSVHITIIAM